MRHPGKGKREVSGRTRQGFEVWNKRLGERDYRGLMVGEGVSLRGGPVVVSGLFTLRVLRREYPELDP